MKRIVFRHHYGIPLIELVYVLGSLQPRGRQRPGLATFSCDRQGPKRAVPSLPTTWARISPGSACALGSPKPRARLCPGSSVPQTLQIGPGFELPSLHSKSQACQRPSFGFAYARGSSAPASPLHKAVEKRGRASSLNSNTFKGGLRGSGPHEGSDACVRTSLVTGHRRCPELAVPALFDPISNAKARPSAGLARASSVGVVLNIIISQTILRTTSPILCTVLLCLFIATLDEKVL